MNYKLLIAVAGIAITLASCGVKDEAKDETVTDIVAKSTGGLKIAFYNQDSLKIYYNYFREQDSLMIIKGGRFQSQLESKNAAIEAYITANDRKAQQGLLSQNDIALIQQQIQQRQYNLSQFQQLEGGKLESETMDILTTIGNRIDTYGENFCKENGIDILLIYSKGGQFNHINSAMDVTIDFTSYLNEGQKEIEAGISDDKD